MAKHALYTAWFLVFSFALAEGVGGPVQVGMPADEVLEALGAPQGRIAKGAREAWTFKQGTLEMEGGRVVWVSPSFGPPKAAAPSPPIPAAQAKPGWKDRLNALLGRKGGAPAPASAPPSNMPVVLVVANGGQSVDLPALLVPGGVTIVDFYADWCPPCRAISPELERLSARDDGVYLRKIDIVNWDSPVAKQFNLSSIPSIRVFNAAGKAVGQPTHRMDEVLKMIEQARP